MVVAAVMRRIGHRTGMSGIGAGREVINIEEEP